MYLFNTSSNCLPFDGEVRYYGPVLSRAAAQSYFEQLLHTIMWENDKAVIFGKLIVTKRKVAWYADHPFDYSYSNTTKSALPWTKEFSELKKLVEKQTGEAFNSCLLNLYHTGEEGMA